MKISTFSNRYIFPNKIIAIYCVAVVLSSCGGGGGTSSDGSKTSPPSDHTTVDNVVPPDELEVSEPYWKGGNVNFQNKTPSFFSSQGEAISYSTDRIYNREAQILSLEFANGEIGKGIFIGDMNAAIFTGFSSSGTQNPLIFGGMSVANSTTTLFEFFGDYYLLADNMNSTKVIPVHVHLDLQNLPQSEGRDEINGELVKIDFETYDTQDNSFEVLITDENVNDKQAELLLIGSNAEHLVGGYNNGDEAGILYLGAEWSDE